MTIAGAAADVAPLVEHLARGALRHFLLAHLSFSPRSNIAVSLCGETVDAGAGKVLSFVITKAFVAVHPKLLTRQAGFRRLRWRDSTNFSPQ